MERVKIYDVAAASAKEDVAKWKGKYWQSVTIIRTTFKLEIRELYSLSEFSIIIKFRGVGPVIAGDQLTLT